MGHFLQTSLIHHDPRGTGPGLIGQPVEPAGEEPCPPLPDGREGDAQGGSDVGVGAAIGCGHDNPCAECESLRGLRPADQSYELGSLVTGQGERGQAGSGHGSPLNAPATPAVALADSAAHIPGSYQTAQPSPGSEWELRSRLSGVAGVPGKWEEMPIRGLPSAAFSLRGVENSG